MSYQSCNFVGLCPLNSLHITKTIKDLYLFAWKLTFKYIFHKDRQNINLKHKLTEHTKYFIMEAFHALRDLMLLYEEGAIEDSSGSTQDGSLDAAVSTAAPEDTPLTQSTIPKKFKPKSQNFPDRMTCPAIWAFLDQSIKDIKHQEWQNCTSNLTTNQLSALKRLQKWTDIIIKPFDKGGNIVVMSHVQYQTCALRY